MLETPYDNIMNIISESEIPEKVIKEDIDCFRKEIFKLQLHNYIAENYYYARPKED